MGDALNLIAACLIVLVVLVLALAGLYVDGWLL